MKSLLAFFLLLPCLAKADGVAGPFSGADFTNPVQPVALFVAGTDDQASQAFAVCQQDASGNPIESTGLFYFRGVAYPTGYLYATTALLYAQNNNL